MSTCKKVKNPCKLCLQPVSQKTGLRCQGECGSWMHYACLHYTPGRVRDIKSGVIQITCPCPDCTSTLPKEFLTDEPFSCSNMQCPAHLPPKCQALECPSNTLPTQLDTSNRCMPPTNKCGYSCNQVGASSANPSPMRSPNSSASPSSGDVGGGGGGLALQAVEQMCNTVGQLSLQLNDLMKTMKNVDRGGGARAPPKRSPCTQKGPRSQCPKPCYCPGNPGRRK